MLKRSRTRLFRFALVSAGLFGAAAAAALMIHRSQPLLAVVHLPKEYPRRSATLSANVTVQASLLTTDVKFRVNDNPWHQVVDLRSSRYVNRVVTLEMPPTELSRGTNSLEIMADGPLHASEQRVLSFEYNPAPLELPIRRRWKGEHLEAQDGYWEVIEVDGESRVRPKPGFEGYDRLLLVTGAFPVPRRIETYAVHRYPVESVRNEVGFGVLSLWGGHPGDWSHLPRDGWSFSMGLYWSKPGGVGGEISHYDETGAPRWVNAYRDMPLIPNEKYFIIIELEQERANERHRAYRQRVKIWPESQPEPEEWIELRDIEGVPLPEAEYGVALFALDNQVEFGPIDVLPLPR